MGAVIGMDGLRADRRQLFDIGSGWPAGRFGADDPVGVYRPEHRGDQTRSSAHCRRIVGRGYQLSLGRPLLVKLLFHICGPNCRRELSVRTKTPSTWPAGSGMLITGST